MKHFWWINLLVLCSFLKTDARAQAQVPFPPAYYQLAPFQQVQPLAQNGYAVPYPNQNASVNPNYATPVAYGSPYGNAPQSQYSMPNTVINNGKYTGGATSGWTLPYPDVQGYPASNTTTGHNLQVDPVQYSQMHQPPESEILNEPGPLRATPPGLTTPKPDVPLNWHGLIWKQNFGEATYIMGSGDNYGATILRASGTLTFAKLPLLSLTPEFGVWNLNGPDNTDLPSNLFNTGLRISWFQPVSKDFQMLFSVSPGVWTDFQSTADMVRVTGMALGFYQWTDEINLAFGAIVLNRDNLSVLPVIGLTYKPDEFHKFEITFPKPRYSWKHNHSPDSNRWWYVGGEFGGGTWAIERANGLDDRVTLTDYRFLVGMENKHNNGVKEYVELGAAFGRKVAYHSDIGNYSPNAAFIARVGINF
jgi:hypothetical protein